MLRAQLRKESELGNNVCYHFIINVSATFCWLNTDHQKTLSKAVCTYLSTNCHVYVLHVCMCVQGEVMQLDGRRTGLNRTGLVKYLFLFLFLSLYFLHTKITKRFFCRRGRRFRGKRSVARRWTKMEKKKKKKIPLVWSVQRRVHLSNRRVSLSLLNACSST